GRLWGHERWFPTPRLTAPNGFGKATSPSRRDTLAVRHDRNLSAAAPRSAPGASRPLPRVPAKVSSPNRERPLALRWEPLSMFTDPKSNPEFTTYALAGGPPPEEGDRGIERVADRGSYRSGAMFFPPRNSK